MRVRHLLIFTACVLTACGGGSSDDDSNSGTTAGSTTTGDTTSGDTTAGETTSGQFTTGDTTSGDTTTGDTTAGNTAGNTGGSTGGGTGGSVQQLGIIDVDQTVVNSNLVRVDLSAGFIRSTSNINLTALTNELQPTSDFCEVSENVGILDGLDDIAGVDFDSIVTISGGETVTFTSPAGTYATLMRETEFGFTGYNFELDGSNPVPTGLTVDIPGDEFPAFSNVPVPAVSPLSGINISTGAEVNANSTITWDASPNSGSTISISVSSGFDFTDPLNSTSTEVDCFVVDDGSFTFPAATQSQMGTLSSFDFSISRSNISITQNGNTVLVISAYSGN